RFTFTKRLAHRPRSARHSRISRKANVTSRGSLCGSAGLKSNRFARVIEWCRSIERYRSIKGSMELMMVSAMALTDHDKVMIRHTTNRGPEMARMRVMDCGAAPAAV